MVTLVALSAALRNWWPQRKRQPGWAGALRAASPQPPFFFFLADGPPELRLWYPGGSSCRATAGALAASWLAGGERVSAQLGAQPAGAAEARVPSPALRRAQPQPGRSSEARGAGWGRGGRGRLCGRNPRARHPAPPSHLPRRLLASLAARIPARLRIQARFFFFFAAFGVPPWSGNPSERCRRR